MDFILFHNGKELPPIVSFAPEGADVGTIHQISLETPLSESFWAGEGSKLILRKISTGENWVAKITSRPSAFLKGTGVDFIDDVLEDKGRLYDRLFSIEIESVKV